MKKKKKIQKPIRPVAEPRSDPKQQLKLPSDSAWIVLESDPGEERIGFTFDACCFSCWFDFFFFFGTTVNHHLSTGNLASIFKRTTISECIFDLIVVFLITGIDVILPIPCVRVVTRSKTIVENRNHTQKFILALSRRRRIYETFWRFSSDFSVF